ncbi:MAG: aldose 1-epimerase family protein [Candidatus Dormibacteria bacterium]
MTDIPALAPASPSGRQFRLRHGEQAAVVTEVGATLRSYTVAGRELLDGFDGLERCRDGRGQLLLPWPNRIAGGSYRFQNRDFQLPIDEQDRQNAIHGLARWLPWVPEVASAPVVVLSLMLFPQPGYDFALFARAEYRLGDDGLRVSITASNRGSEPLPWGLGAHPYLTLGSPRVDDLEIRVPAGLRLTLDAGLIPVGAPVPVAGTEFDFRRWRRLGALPLDTTFTGLIPDEGGRAVVELRLPSSPDRLRLWMDPSHRFVQLFTGDSLPDPGVRRRGLAVEPMTCAPNAFRSGDGLLTLAPGQSTTSTWGVHLSR